MLPRREFSKETKRAALARSGGVCECHLMPWIFPVACGLRLGHGNTFFEHINPDGAGGGNDIANAAVLTRTCWKAKTDSYDKGKVAKVIRQRDFNDNTETETSPYQRLPFGRNSNLKRTFRQFGPARIIDRTTGQPWKGWR